MSGRRVWTRQSIIEAIQRWNAQYGAPPTAMDWNTAQARREGRLDLVQRWGEGNWPHYGSVTNTRFDSWNAAIRAAGLTPRGPGERGGCPPLAEGEQTRARMLYGAGYGVRTIARDLDLSLYRVEQFLRSNGLRRTQREAVLLSNARKRKTPA